MKLWRYLFENDRFDRSIRVVITCAFLFAIALPLVVMFIFLPPLTQNTAHAPQVWFSRVVKVSAKNFTEIEHFTVQGIDYSHYFKFKFSDVSDIERIVRSNELVVSPMNRAVELSNTSGCPEWYLDSLSLSPPPSGIIWVNNGLPSDITIFFVDYDRKVAWLELHHF